MFCNVFLAAIQIFDPYRGSESFQGSCESFDAPASAFRSQYMLHRPSDDTQRKGLVGSSTQFAGTSRGRSALDSKWLCEAIHGSGSAHFSDRVLWMSRIPLQSRVFVRHTFKQVQERSEPK